MLEPVRNWFTFLHRRTKNLLKRRRRRRTAKRLSSNSEFFNSSFKDMGLSNQFEQVFKLIDANGDGKISTIELSEVLLSLGFNKKSIATKEAECMVKEMDFNGDGFVDLEEFMVAMNNPDGKNDTCIGEDYLKDAFMIFDTDKNGLISDKELQRVLINLGYDKCRLEECKRMIKGVDKNGDGFVDFEEFQSMMTAGVVN
ncbi:putative EF hand calcium-binding family protein [Quillaja saponaria]|uniref:EF hand calcium-binding family protein n=1 Tax=Quillaja saponaria TaxID=32244 RepID=A0AAD7LQ97_QUISA|nr:putative EF hand calcium-binding family protein [Quillaja saponaria]